MHHIRPINTYEYQRMPHAKGWKIVEFLQYVLNNALNKPLHPNYAHHRYA